MKIILLHGALGAGEQLYPLAEELKTRNIEPVILELPGHGKTPIGSHNFTIGGFSKWLDKTMEEQQLWGSSFFGFSMGGYIMLNLLREQKRNMKCIITLGTKFNWDPKAAEEETSRLNPDKILEKVPKFAEMLAHRHINWKDVLKHTKELMLALGENSLLNKSSTHSIYSKVYIFRGSADQMVGNEESKAMASSLPNANFEELAGIPHPIEQVPPKDLADLIEKTIKEC